jgi:hypothetical protein
MIVTARVVLTGLTLVVALGMRPAVARGLEAGIYGLATTGDFESAAKKAHEAGFDMAVVNAKRAALDVLHANGLKAIVALWLRREAVKDEESWKQEVERVRESILQVRDHPAVFAWYLTDEPDGAGIPVEKVKELCDVVRSVAPNTPLFAVFDDPRRWAPYLELFDIVAVDPYLRRNASGQYAAVTVVSDWLDQLHNDLKRLWLERRVWVVLGAFDLRPKSGAPRRYRKPTPDEFRGMYGLARRSNVEGVLVYTYGFGSTELNHGWNLPIEDPPLWSAIGDAINGRE